jgi:hypothetical protein
MGEGAQSLTSKFIVGKSALFEIRPFDLDTLQLIFTLAASTVSSGFIQLRRSASSFLRPGFD